MCCCQRELGTTPFQNWERAGDTVNFPPSALEGSLAETHCDSKRCLISNREQELRFNDLRNTSVQPMEQTFASKKSSFKQGGTSYFAKSVSGSYKYFSIPRCRGIRGRKRLMTV